MERLDVVGMPAGGWRELGETGRELIAGAAVLIGGRRQLGLVPEEVTAERVPLPSPLRAGLPGLLSGYVGRRVVVLASGDPLLYGIGATLVDLLGPEQVRVHPAVSAVALARARMGWSSEQARTVSAVGRDLALVRRWLVPGQCLVVLSAGSESPAALADLLTDAGYGASRLTVLSDLGTEVEGRIDLTAAQARGLDDVPALNLVAVECRPSPAARVLGIGPGLPDEVYEHDGQITKRDPRASALARLAPAAGELLWDLGAGAGSVAIEWARSDPRCQAIAVERSPDRAARIVANANRLGVPGLAVITADVTQVPDRLPRPDAIFIGGGADPELIRRCWHRLPARGRLVVHAVTVETELILVQAWRTFGGELTRISVERMAPLGGFHGWQPARAVVQWSATRPDDGRPRAASEASVG